LGHKDNIDNILYATSVLNKMFFLTMDYSFKKFLEENGYNTDNLINHIQLIEILF